MSRRMLLSLMLGFLTVASGASAAGKMQQVTVVGQGMTIDEAVTDGKRKAVEQVFVKIYSSSQTQDFVLVKDTVLTRSAGFVKEYQILSKGGDEDMGWEVKMRVTVLTDPLDDLWGVVTNLLQDMGRPKIMVVLTEKVDGVVLEDSTVQTVVENMLMKSGFQVVGREMVQAAAARDLQAAIASDDPAAVQAIAKRFDAPIFVTGIVRATQAAGSPRQIYGMTKYIYEADSNVKVYRTDTGQMMSAVPAKATRGVQGVARSAAKQAMDQQGKLVAPAITQDILRFWMDAIGGRGEVKLRVSNISFTQYAKLKKALSEIDGVKDVRANYHNQIADMSIQTNLQAEPLGLKIVEAMEGTLEITDMNQNTLKAKFVK